jgi:MOSC domain-containing protein YiiM
MSQLPPSSPMHTLMQQFPREGKVVWIGVRPASRKPVKEVSSVTVRIGTGLDGDRYRGKPESKRQVTLIQQEDLAAIASYLGKDSISPFDLRRNIVVSGINLLALKDKTFRIGNVVLEYTGECHPCSRMEEALGNGGYNAMRQHGGITAKVLEEGNIAVGDSLMVLPEP